RQQGPCSRHCKVRCDSGGCSTAAAERRAVSVVRRSGAHVRGGQRRGVGWARGDGGRRDRDQPGPHAVRAARDEPRRPAGADRLALPLCRGQRAARDGPRHRVRAAARHPGGHGGAVRAGRLARGGARRHRRQPRGQRRKRVCAGQGRPRARGRDSGRDAAQGRGARGAGAGRHAARAAAAHHGPRHVRDDVRADDRRPRAAGRHVPVGRDRVGRDGVRRRGQVRRRQDAARRHGPGVGAGARGVPGSGDHQRRDHRPFGHLQGRHRRARRAHRRHRQGRQPRRHGRRDARHVCRRGDRGHGRRGPHRDGR
ncbi:hypothetical protein GGH95_006944, partial [Coemansia sp. RSA 1836]